MDVLHKENRTKKLKWKDSIILVCDSNIYYNFSKNMRKPAYLIVRTIRLTF